MDIDAVIAAVICTALCIGAAFGGAIGLETYSCSGYEKATGRPTKYTRLNCYVQHDDGKWYLKDEYKFIALNGVQ